MASAVPQRILSWLHSVLGNDYRDVNRSYSDIAQALHVHQSLRLKTDVYTFETGASSLLVNVHGSLPVTFRGTTYGFPVSLWIPQEYPSAPPIGFVIPTKEMVIRPGQYVSGEGRLYHPYLAGWSKDRSSISDLVSLFQGIFAREPPLVARESSSQLPPAPQQHQRAPPPVPPLPPEIGRSNHILPTVQSPKPDRPPPKPPKGEDTVSKYDRPAPLPRQGQQLRGYAPQAVVHTNAQVVPPKSGALPISEGPPQQHLQFDQRVPFAQDPRRSFNGPATPISPLDNKVGYNRQPGTGQDSPHYPAQYQTSQYGNSRAQQSNFPHPPIQHPTQQPPLPQAMQPPKPKPAEDLLTSPFDTAMPLQVTNVAPPPIPPNPQKDALLSTLSRTLTQQIQAVHNSNMLAITPLRAQQAALTSTLNAINREISQLDDLETLLTSNESILRRAMRDADKVLDDAKRRKVPNVDEVLVAPTVVAGQLYRTVAEEKAIEDARGALGKALDKGKIGGFVWAKQSRSLAREEFLKKALVKKISQGMGLARDTQWQ